MVGVRGLVSNDNDKITLLVNGQKVLGLHEQEFLNGPINLDNLDRVEVVVGSSSFFQQADTLAGTVNLITRNIDGVEAIASAGNYVQYSTTLMAGHRWDSDKFVNFPSAPKTSGAITRGIMTFVPALPEGTPPGNWNRPAFSAS